MAPTVTEAKFNDLKAKLRELFELDKSDLDFGIYRIMAAKNREVNEFLDRQLKAAVRDTLAAHGTGATAEIESQIQQAQKAAHAAGFNPDESPTVKELKATLASGGAASASELEADIYNHLLAFFSRYYDEGDFISKRRYKGDVYAIPYNGQEVTLHWANKDQYYIKSGEWHKDYRFKTGGKTVHFKLVEATQEANNNKEPDDAKRRFILAADQPVEANDSELTLRFEFRVPTEAEKQAVPDCTRIFGGKYAAAASRTKGDEREQFCADAEQRALAAMPETWKGVASAPAATEARPARTVLGRHLEDFTARNTFDYFIHKDLGGFLKRELDFYIKNEVVRLDDLEALPADHLARLQGKVKAIRTVAGRIIDFLASIENFQKKIWLKKKFVLETNWLVTVDRIPANLRDIVAANPTQWAEWEAMGFKPTGDGRMLLRGSGPKWGTREYLDANDKLIVDTSLYSRHFPIFTPALLAAGEPRAPKATPSDALTGLLIHSENFQALRLLHGRYRGEIRSVQIDPPYNTATSGFLYKNAYEHSTWLSMMEDRIALASSLLDEHGTFTCHIDENEYERLNIVFGGHGLNQAGTIVWDKKNPMLGRKGIATQHEYIICRTKHDAPVVGYSNSIASMQEHIKSLIEEHGGVNEPAREKYRLWLAKQEGLSGGERAYRFVDNTGEIYRLVAMGAPELRADPKFHIPLSHPTTGKLCPVPPNGWSRTPETLADLANKGMIIFGDDEATQPQKKVYLKDDAQKQITSVYNDGRSGKANLDPMELEFPYCHPVSMYEHLLSVAGGASTCLDFFAGSGTTGHAVINLNREDGNRRKFILVEMGAHFHTVLKPRIAKALYSPEWKDGNAQVHGKGTSALVKYFALESYEDALNNLPAPTGELLAHADPATTDALITYSLDLEMGPKLLNLEAFRDPWGYSINAQPGGAAEIKPHRVDLVETFNYLLGLKVKAYGPLEQYSADFVHSEHDDNLGRLKVKGRLKRDAAGPFVFQRVEGELLDGTRVLIIWRKLTGHAEQDAAALEAWMLRHREETKERSDYREYHQIYINGPVTLPQPTAEIRTVMPIEQTFKDRMFADREGD